jgi:peroxiredoxin
MQRPGMSVNDKFVMRAWAEDQKLGPKITMLADGAAIIAKV